jgi:cobalt/nickel transport system permease protein
MTPTRSSRLLWLAGLVAALILAGVVSFYASAEPDGLERVAEDQGISEQAAEHPAAGSPLADYQASGVEDSRLSGAIAGVVGVGVVLVFGSGVTWAVRRRAADDPAGIASGRSAPTHGG